MTSIWAEIKRRNVARVAIAYAVVSWLLIEVSTTTFPMLRLPEWAATLVTVLLIIGFPIALIFAWAFELTPEGLKKEKDVDRSESITHVTGRKLDFAIIAVLAIAVVFLVVDKIYLTEGDGTPDEVIATERQSIAVLPFVNMSDDPGNEYFSDGISEEILNLLADIPELRVTSRSSAFSFKGQNVDVPTMAARLNVAHVLEGSVRKSGDQLRITAQLINVANDSHLWSETYDRELRNVFAIQDEIAAAVVDSLQITLLGREPRAAETSPEAYALYLQARHFREQFTAEDNSRAEILLKQALAIDPDFAPAWVALGGVYISEGAVFGQGPNNESFELARQAAQRALVLDPQNGRAYATLAAIDRLYDRDFVAASRHLQQALALDPGDARIVGAAADLATMLGRIDEALELRQRAIILDPLNGHGSLAATLSLAGRLEEAEESMRTALSLKPDAAALHYRLGRMLLLQGDAEAALAEVAKEPHDAYRLTGMALIRHTLGDARASDAALEELIELDPAGAGYQIAEAYAFRGEVDEAFDWLERAYENRDTGLPYMMIDSLLTSLHDDPRWEPFLDKMGLPH